MKYINIILLWSWAVVSFGQSDATMTTQSNQIKNETVAGANTANRVGTLFLNLTTAKGNKQEANTWTALQTMTAGATNGGLRLGTKAGADPSSTATGQLYFDTDDAMAKYQNGSAWYQIIGSAGLTATRIPFASAAAGGLGYVLTDDADMTFTGGNTLNITNLNVTGGCVGCGIGGLTTNRVIFATSATTIGDDAGFSFNPTLDHLFVGNRIGTGTSPTYGLDIVASNEANGTLRVQQTSTFTVAAVFDRTAGTASQWVVQLPAASTDLRFFSGVDKFWFTTGPRLGIGASPTYGFDLTASTEAEGTHRVKQTSTFTLATILERTGGTASNWQIYLPAGSTDLRFFGGGSDRYWFRDTGQLGVGATPGANIYLDVVNSNASSVAQRIRNTSTGEVNLTLDRTGGTTSAWAVYLPSGSTDMRVFNAVDRFIFEADGDFQTEGLIVTDLTATGRILFSSSDRVVDDSDFHFNTSGNILTLTSGVFTSDVTDMDIRGVDIILRPNVAAGNPILTLESTATTASITSTEALDISGTGNVGIFSSGSGNNVNITAITASDVNVTGSDDINLVSEGDDIIVSAFDDLQLIPSGDLQIGSSATDALTTNGIVYSSTWTPTLTGVVNVDGGGLTAFSNQFTRVGSNIIASIYLTVNVTSTTAQTILEISLPVASNFASAIDAVGSADVTIGGGANGPALLYGSVANDRLVLDFNSLSNGVHECYITVVYRIL